MLVQSDFIKRRALLYCPGSDSLKLHQNLLLRPYELQNNPKIEIGHFSRSDEEAAKKWAKYQGRNEEGASRAPAWGYKLKKGCLISQNS